MAVGELAQEQGCGVNHLIYPWFECILLKWDNYRYRCCSAVRDVQAWFSSSVIIAGNPELAVSELQHAPSFAPRNHLDRPHVQCCPEQIRILIPITM